MFREQVTKHDVYKYRVNTRTFPSMNLYLEFTTSDMRPKINSTIPQFVPYPFVTLISQAARKILSG